MDHVDPACAYYAFSHQVTRLFTRQLFGYRTTLDDAALVPVPDVAAELPTVANGGLSADGRHYRIRLRPGVVWDTDPPRPVTAADFVRGFKRMCNPVAGAGAIAYFTSTIRGMAEFHDDFAAAIGADPTAAELAAFQNGHEIAGVFALDDESLVFELVRPVLDFISILALPGVAPAAVEYNAFLPDSPQLRANLRSTGPYRVTRYVAGRELVLEPNPVWRQETDPIRRQYPDRIEVGLGGPADPVELARQIDTGAIDLAWNAPVPQPHGLRPAEPDTGLGFRLDPCLVFNLLRSAPRDEAVRRAISHAIDRSAVAEAVLGLGTGAAVRVADGVVPPNNDGRTGGDPHPAPLADRARELLAEAGHPGGLTLTVVHTDTPEATAVARCCAADLERVGITVRLVALSQQAHREVIADPVGEWDVTTVSLSPSWQHDNSRVFLQRLFPGGCPDPEVDDLIERALDTIDPRHANAIWQRVERRVLDDALVVPLLFQVPAVPRLHGSRVRDAVAMPSLGYEYDLATVWLDSAGDPSDESGRSGEPAIRTRS